jgi:peptide/nickel transport system permease protein
VSDSATGGGLARRLFAHRSAQWSLVIIGLIVLAATIGPRIYKYTGREQPDVVGMKNQPPSSEHPFGTDQYSRDVLGRFLSGARLSLAISSVAVLLSMTLGTTYGLIAGYFGGRVDALLMRILDAFLAIPRVLLLIAILTPWRPGLVGLVVVIGCTGWFGVSRLVRAETMTIRQLDYVAAARALGAPTGRVLWRHLLPNVAGPIIVAATLAVGNVIVLEAGLSYLGAGVREPNASWGSLFLDGATSFAGAWWVVFFPGAAIVATVLAFNVLGDALRDVVDPRQLPGSRSLLAPSDPFGTGTEPTENG